MVIARRTLTILKDGATHPVEVRIFAPVEDDRCWGCRLQIDWPHGMRDFIAHGHDSVQALLLALDLVGVYLYTSGYHEDGHLQSLGPDWVGYGFPVPHNLRDLLIGQDAEYL